MTIAENVSDRGHKRFETLESDMHHIHNNKYRYDKAVYRTMLTKIVITCQEHGDFLQTPAKHVVGEECPKCAREKVAKTRTASQQEFLDKVKGLESIYDFSKSIYYKAKEKLIVTCKVHGDFLISPNKLLQGRGCPACKPDKISSKLRRETDVFIQLASTLYGNKYSYDKLAYRTCKDTIIVICPTHGEFTTTPDKHLNKHGCPECIKEDLLEKSKFSFIERSTVAHKNRYDYTSVTYTSGRSPVKIKCPIHGEFEQLPSTHVRGAGCPYCSDTGFNKSKPGILYYLKINGGQAYKIGITNRTINERFSTAELNCIDVLATKYYELGEEAYIAEQQVLRDYKEYKYEGAPLLISGNTELFNIDVLGLDLDIFSQARKTQ